MVDNEEQQQHASESTPLIGSSTSSSGNAYKEYETKKGKLSLNFRGRREYHESILPSPEPERDNGSAAVKNSLHTTSQSELNHLVEQYAADDNDEDKTWARLFVERYLQKVSTGQVQLARIVQNVLAGSPIVVCVKKELEYWLLFYPTPSNYTFFFFCLAFALPAASVVFPSSRHSKWSVPLSSLGFLW